MNIQFDTKLSDILKSSEEIIEKKNIYIFFSFDLVGSTKFKTEKTNWPYVIPYFYDTVYKELKYLIPQIKVWKYLGDEILLYVSICDFDSPSVIYTIPDTVYSIQLKVAEAIQKVSKTKKLDVKSTIWMAAARTVESKKFNLSNAPKTNRFYKNMKVKLNVEDQDQVDFLGPDMDIGFRIAKFAFHHKIVLSADFAYFLHLTKPENCDIDEKLQIVSFEILKGVWNEQYYPIIWYYPDWKTKPYGFFYADHKKNEIAERVLSERVERIDKLENVYKELEKTDEINKFVKECSKMNFSKKRSFLLPLETKK